MRVVETEIPEVRLLEPLRHADDRGFLAEVYRADRWRGLGLDFVPVQENHSRSARGVVRGLHFQAPPAAQAKVVRAVRGRIFDVAVDLREGSPTYGRWVGAELDAEEGRQLFVPRGFAHGFCALTEPADVSYLLDAPYAPGSEGGLLWNDPDVGVAWPLDEGEMRLSDRDRRWPRLADIQPPFPAAPDGSDHPA